MTASLIRCEAVSSSPVRVSFLHRLNVTTLGCVTSSPFSNLVMRPSPSPEPSLVIFENSRSLISSSDGVT